MHRMWLHPSLHLLRHLPGEVRETRGARVAREERTKTFDPRRENDPDVSGIFQQRRRPEEHAMINTACIICTDLNNLHTKYPSSYLFIHFHHFTIFTCS